MTKKIERSRTSCGEKLDPMLCYCSKVISELNDDETNKLIDELLHILKDFSPSLRTVKNRTSLIELLDWEELLDKGNSKLSQAEAAKKIGH